jgi:RuvA, C-terminal domain
MPDCGRAEIDAAGESHAVDPAVAEMAACDGQEVGRVDGGPHVGAREVRRATQTIPPAIRRLVLRRDRGRCVVPGCSNHVFLDVHHLDARAEGGGHDPDRLSALCGNHHRAVHAGRLSIDGSASAGFAVRHVDGTEYGAPLRPAALDLARQALGTLEHLGFTASQARARVDAVVRAGAPADIETFVRAALASAS